MKLYQVILLSVVFTAIAGCSISRQAKAIDQSRVGSIDISRDKANHSDAPKGKYVRLRPLQNRGIKGIDGDYWQYKDRTAQDVLRLIRKLQPTVLERYISGPLDPNVLVVCHCYRENDKQIRIISARKGDKQEQKQYWGFIK